MDCCCKRLFDEINCNKKTNIIYDSPLRCFGIGTIEFYTPMDYCPFCGKKFKDSLVDEYWEYLIAEAGAEYYPTDENYDPTRPVPSEFRSDEWWKKRGL